MKKGFTLVEVLAVIAILGLIVAISIPKVTSTIRESEKEAFRIDAQMILQAVELKIARGLDYDITTLNVTDLKSVFGIDNTNFKTITLTYENEVPYLTLEGKNKWEGLTAYGTQDKMTVSESTYYDETAPVITLIGSSQVYLEVGAIYYEVGATAIDNHDGDISSKITMQGNLVNTSVAGTYLLNYAVSDFAGNTSSITRTVTVFNNEAPTVEFGMNGNSTYAKTRSTSVLVSDNVAVIASSLKYQWTTSTTAPTEASFSTSFTNGATITTPAGVSGGYYLWILAKDQNGNTMIEKSSVFNLDNTAPVITLSGSSPLTIQVKTSYVDAGATATDNIDGTITSRIVTVNPVNTNVTNAYSVTYNVTDSAGNTATQVVRTVNVIFTVDYLVVAGGGGGGGDFGGGGGAGEFIESSGNIPSTAAITVGSGGLGLVMTAACSGSTAGSSGGDSSIGGVVTAKGGGLGGGGNASGATGGSGGGGGYNAGAAPQGGASTKTVGFGNAGGAGGGANPYAGGGGGGAGGAGVAGSGGYAGAGGAGKTSSISGSTLQYAGGGGGGGMTATGSASYGGGSGGTSSYNGVSGAANTGSGGGGAYGCGTLAGNDGGNGGSGIVIIRYLGSQKATGGIISSSGGYTIHTFTSSGTLTVLTS